jgi:hypothetical protein
MEIYKAIAEIQRELDAIGKTKQNKQQGFNFRGIDDVYNALHPLLAKHGVFTVPEVLEDRSEDRQTKSGGQLIYRILRMKYTFYAIDGSSVAAVVIGEGMDSGDKASNKAMSIAHKYAFFQVFSIPTEEVAASDPENYSHELASAAAQWVTAIETTDTMEALQQCFADAWKSCKDQRSRNEITAAKDKRKKELS